MNHKKAMAKKLVFMMDEQKRLQEEDLTPWEEEDIRLFCKEVRDDIFKSGYDINELMYLGEEYKTLTFEQHREWIRQ